MLPSTLLFSMKPCIFLIKLGSLTALFPASASRITRKRNRICHSSTTNIVFKRSSFVKINFSCSFNSMNSPLTIQLCLNWCSALELGYGSVCRASSQLLKNLVGFTSNCKVLGISSASCNELYFLGNLCDRSLSNSSLV